MGEERNHFLFSSLPSPPSSAPYFSHSLPILFPSRKFLETHAMQANINMANQATPLEMGYKDGKINADERPVAED